MRHNQNCNGCGLCEKSCPRANIKLTNSNPNFNNKCVLCLKCIYGCPQKALNPGIGKFVVIKQGYNLNDIEKRVEEFKLDSLEEFPKSYLWKGIKEYLLDEE